MLDDHLQHKEQAWTNILKEGPLKTQPYPNFEIQYSIVEIELEIKI